MVFHQKMSQHSESYRSLWVEILRWNRFQVSPQPTSAQASGNNFIQSAHKVKSKITTFSFFRFLLKKNMIFMIWSRSHPQNQWKVNAFARPNVQFSLVLGVTPGPNRENHDFFNKNRKKQNVVILDFTLCALCIKLFPDAWADVGCGLTWKKFHFSCLNIWLGT